MPLICWYAQACRQPPPKLGTENRDPDNPEVFFYSMQYDSTVKRWEDTLLEEHAHLREPLQRWQVCTPHFSKILGQ